MDTVNVYDVWLIDLLADWQLGNWRIGLLTSRQIDELADWRIDRLLHPVGVNTLLTPE